MMKRILWLFYILLTLAPLAFSQNGFSIHIPVTYDHTLVPNTDQTSFPVAVSTNQTSFAGVQSNFKTTGNGGKATSSSGFDIIPHSDVGCTTRLTFEWVTQSYGASTGAIEMHVIIATLSHTTNGTFYLCVGKSSITTNQSTLTWTGYSLVNHMSDTAGSGTFSDSSSQGNSMANIFGGMADAAGELGRGGSGNGGGGISGTANGLPSGNGARTMSAWFKMASLATNGSILGFGTNASNQRFMLYFNPNGGNPAVSNDLGGTTWGFTYAGDTTNWFHIVWTLPAGGNFNQGLAYLNGVQSLSGQPSATVNTVLGGLMASQLCCSGSQNFGLNGSLDELRIKNTDESADWIVTEYNNQKPSSTFLTFGAVTSAGYMMPFVADVQIPIWTPRILFPLMVQR